MGATSAWRSSGSSASRASGGRPRPRRSTAARASKPRGASRGGYSDGSYGGAAAKWVHDWGALFRQPYPELGFDLTHYDSSRAKSWGNFGCGGSGDKGQADGEAKKHPVRSVALVKNFRGGGRGDQRRLSGARLLGPGLFSSKRDKAEGFARASGSWSHCMCFIGVRHDRPGLLCLNSWGPNWISGPKWPEDQPDGSFWVEAATATRMLKGEDSFAVSAYEGFPYRDLKHGDWVRSDSGGSPAGKGARAEVQTGRVHYSLRSHPSIC
jgi:hypothetical protein